MGHVAQPVKAKVGRSGPNGPYGLETYGTFDSDTQTAHNGPVNTEQGEIVRNERLRRGWSMRRAGEAGGTSHSQWDRIERGEDRRAANTREIVAQAFDWPLDWPENPPAPPVVSQRDDQVMAALTSMMEQIAALTAQVARLEDAARRAAPAPRRSQS
jgi:transcriptional regulator with XRE-family HTH domain